jgi:hypothetical protein
MANSKSSEGHNRRSTGNVVEPGDGFLPNGHPNLSPSAGYVAAEPVQYADESDSQFQMRLDMWNSAIANAKAIEGNADYDFQREQLKLKYDNELAGIDAAEDRAAGKVPKK